MRPKFMNDATWKMLRPWLFLAVVIILFIYILWNIQSINGIIAYIIKLFQSLIYGIVFAYILNIPMKLIERFIIKHSRDHSIIRRSKRPIAMTLTFILALVLVIILGSIILPNIMDSMISLFNNLTNFFKDIVKNIDGILAYFHIDYQIERLEQVEEFINMPWKDVLNNAITFLTNSATGLLSNAGAFLSSFAVGFTGFMFSLYLLSGKEAFIRQMRKVIAAVFGYEKASSIFTYAGRVNKIFYSFISGQLVEACILWILYYVSMRLFGFPYPELICTLIAIFSFIPVFGPMLAMFIGAIMMLSIDPMKSIWFIIFYQLMSQFEDNVIYPRVVGNSVGLPGLWVLLSIFVFGSMFGIFGMIIAVPTTACFYVFFAEVINKKLRQRGLQISDTTMELINKDQDE